VLLFDTTNLAKTRQPRPNLAKEFDTDFASFCFKGLKILPKPDNISQFLTPKQVQAARLLACGHTHQAVADNVGVTRQTITNWLNRNTCFRSTVDQLRAEIEQRSVKVATLTRRNLTYPDTLKDFSKPALTPQQHRAAELLATGKTFIETATEVGVTRQTISQWFNHDEAFQREYEARRTELWQAGSAKLRSLIPKAVDVLALALESKDSDAIKAAVALLRLVGLNNAPAPMTRVDLADLEAGRECRQVAEMITDHLRLDEPDEQVSEVISITERKTQDV